MAKLSLKRLQCAALALLMLTAAACSNSGNGQQDPAVSSAGAETTAADPEAPVEEETEEVFDPGVPVNDYGGSDFTFYIRKCGANFWTVKDIWTEELNGEALNDAIYNRNDYINTTYNVSIGQEFMGDNGACATYVNKMVTAGENMDAVICNGNDTTVIAGKGQCMDLTEVPYLNLEQKWWDQNSIHDLSLKITPTGEGKSLS